MRELRVRLQPKQILFKEAINCYPVVLFGGARGGGKSYALRNIFLGMCAQRPGTTAAIFRKTFPELDSNHIRPLFQEHPALREFWNESKKLLTLPNGSTLQFSHCSSENDIGLYQGREIHLLGIDEAGTWTEGMFRTLLGSNRSSNPRIPARCALTANPGNTGHQWLKRLFVERRFNERERANDYHFIQSLIADNPALIDSDPDYVHRLNTEPNEMLRRAYLHGDWDTLAGAFYSELDRNIHLIKPFDIPRHWNRFGAYDYGHNHPAAFGWFANDEDGNTYLYRELVKAKTYVSDFAKELNEYPDTQALYPIVAGHDCWTQKSVLKDTAAPPTVAEEFQSHGILIKRAVVDRIQGAAHLRSYLALRGAERKPRFYIFETCPVTFDTISRMIHDPDRVEDVLKVDATGGDPLSGDDCFARGTLIATDKGQKPIELIAPGDLVWTRAGLKPVVDSWMNSLGSKVLKMVLSDGSNVLATANHKFWDGNEFRSIDTFRYGMIVACLNQRQLYSMASSSADIPTPSGRILETITGLLETSPEKAWELCMSKYGRKSMAPFPSGTTFITRMGIRSTIAWKTWRRSIIRLIAKSISKTQEDWPKLESILLAFDRLLAPGIEATLVANGTVRMLHAPGLNEKGSRHIVWSAPPNFIRLIQSALSFAVIRAERGAGEKLLEKQKTASYANLNSISQKTRPHSSVPGLARLNVERICDGGISDTYSLHVADCHEYFANGILVANCYDMVRYGLMSRPAITDKLLPKHPVGSKEWHAAQSEIDWQREREKLIEGQGEWPEQPTDTWNIQL